MGKSESLKCWVILNKQTNLIAHYMCEDQFVFYKTRKSCEAAGYGGDKYYKIVRAIITPLPKKKSKRPR